MPYKKIIDMVDDKIEAIDDTVVGIKTLSEKLVHLQVKESELNDWLDYLEDQIESM